jgi:hypothetical protein
MTAKYLHPGHAALKHESLSFATNYATTHKRNKVWIVLEKVEKTAQDSWLQGIYEIEE